MGTPDAIRVNRVKLGLTQAQLAREIGVDTRQINRYETGETEPTLAIARRLADKLRITMDELAGGLSPLNGTWHSAWHNLDPDATKPSTPAPSSSPNKVTTSPCSPFEDAGPGRDAYREPATNSSGAPKSSSTSTPSSAATASTPPPSADAACSTSPTTAPPSKAPGSASRSQAPPRATSSSLATSTPLWTAFISLRRVTETAVGPALAELGTDRPRVNVDHLVKKRRVHRSPGTSAYAFEAPSLEGLSVAQSS